VTASEVDFQDCNGDDAASDDDGDKFGGEISTNADDDRIETVPRQCHRSCPHP
jgi:hypothetical protein